MAHLTLEGKEIVVIFDADGSRIKTGITVKITDNLEKKVMDAMSNALALADKKYENEIIELGGKVDREAKKIRGQLTAVPKTAAQGQQKKTTRTPLPEKTITAPSPKQPTDTTARTDTTRMDTTTIVPVKTDWINEIKSRLEEAAGGELTPIEYLYENSLEIKKYLNAETTKEQQKAATGEVFAALNLIPAFRLKLLAQTDDFIRLRTHLYDNNGSLEGAGPDAIKEASAYIRYFLIDLRPLASTAGYDKELGQMPGCKDRLGGTNTLAVSKSETMIAAALFIRRWNLEQKQVPESSIPVWQIQKAEQPKQQTSLPQDTLPPRNMERREIRITW
jgi:hypothetical protein